MISSRYTLFGGTAVITAAAVIGLGSALSGSAGARAQETAARQAAAEFFQTLDARQYARTCDLLAAAFYRRNHVPDKARCELALRIGFTWAPSYRFRIIAVRVDGRRAVVRALTNGVPGRLVLVEEAGRFKVLSVQGG